MASSSSGLDSLPPEIIGHILLQCELPEDVKVMVSTCRFIRGSFSPSIIIAFGRANIPCFDLALMAVRATALVHEAEKKCVVPPAIDPDTITVAARAPSPTEFWKVCDMDHFTSCLQARYIGHPHDRYDLNTAFSMQAKYFCAENVHFPSHEANRMSVSPTVTAGEPPEWETRFRSAVYLTLLLGALLARPYQQPFITSDLVQRFRTMKGRNLKKGPPKSEPKFKVWNPADNVELWNRQPSFRKWIKSYLRRSAAASQLKSSPVFDFVDETKRHEETFGAVGRWLVKYLLEDVRSRPYTLTELTGPPRLDGLEGLNWSSWGTLDEAEGVLWAIMQSLHASEFINGCIDNFSSQWEPYRDRGRTKAAQMNAHHMMRRNVRVVLFGIFTSELVRMPDIPNCLKHISMLAYPSPLRTSTFMDCIDITGTLGLFFAWGKIPNYFDGGPAPPPPFQFYSHVLRKQFNMQFDESTFSEGSWGLFWIFRSDTAIITRCIECTDRKIGLQILSRYEESKTYGRRIQGDPRKYQPLPEVYHL